MRLNEDTLLKEGILMPEKQVENIAFVLDSSRSMYRRDYKPSRLSVCKEAIVNFFRTRRSEDTKTGYSLIVIGNEIKELMGFDDYWDEGKLNEILDK